MSLSTFFGKSVYKGFLQQIYDLTLETFRSFGETAYAPNLSDYEDEKYGIVKISQTGGARIAKPGAGNKDSFIIEKLNIKESVAECELSLYLNTVDPDVFLEDFIKDLTTIINIGPSKIKRALRDLVNQTFSNSLINDKFVVILNKITITADSDSGALIITYNFTTIDEESVRPGGREYQKVKHKTKVGKIID